MSDWLILPFSNEVQNFRALYEPKVSESYVYMREDIVTWIPGNSSLCGEPAFTKVIITIGRKVNTKDRKQEFPDVAV